MEAHGESTEGANKGPVFVEPAAEAVIKLGTSGTLLATSYCNIHGVWESCQVIAVES